MHWINKIKNKGLEKSKCVSRKEWEVCWQNKFQKQTIYEYKMCLGKCRFLFYDGKMRLWLNSQWHHSTVISVEWLISVYTLNVFPWFITIVRRIDKTSYSILNLFLKLIVSYFHALNFNWNIWLKSSWVMLC